MTFKKRNIPWNEGLKGVQKHSDETKKKISQTLKGKTFEQKYGEEKAKEYLEKYHDKK